MGIVSFFLFLFFYFRLDLMILKKYIYAVTIVFQSKISGNDVEFSILSLKFRFIPTVLKIKENFEKSIWLVTGLLKYLY